MEIAIAAGQGRPATNEFAEGWRRHLHYGFCEETADPLLAALYEYCHAVA